MRVAVGLALLAGCAPDGAPPPGPGPLPDPSAPGPFRVGWRELPVTWSGGLQEVERPLRVAAWYPTDATSGPEARYQGAIPAPGVLADAAPRSGPHPLAVFSHGHQAYAEAASFLMEHLASHGWVVVAPDHTGNTTFDGPDRTTGIYWQRPLDLTAVIDHALTGAIAPIDADRIVVLGHSFGGYTAHAIGGAEWALDTLLPGCADGTDDGPFCSTLDDAQVDLFAAGLGDPRVRALIPMAPGDWRLFQDGLAAIDVPVLLMTGGEDGSVGTDGDPIWADLDGPLDLRVHLPGGGHNAFTDFSGTALDPTATLDPEEGFRIVSTYALLFAEDRTGGRVSAEGAALLSGEAGLSDEAEVSTR